MPKKLDIGSGLYEKSVLYISFTQYPQYLQLNKDISHAFVSLDSPIESHMMSVEQIFPVIDTFHTMNPQGRLMH